MVERQECFQFYIFLTEKANFFESKLKIMKATDFNQLLQTLPNLTDQQREELAQRVKLAEKLFPNTSTKRDPLSETFYEALSHILKLHGQQSPPFSAFGKLDVAKHYHKQLQTIQPFLVQLRSPSEQLTKVQWLAVYSQCLRILVETIEIVPLSLKTVVNHLHLIPSVLEQAFPGYLDDGLLLWALTAPPVSVIE